jgi:hypothetical protein
VNAEQAAELTPEDQPASSPLLELAAVLSFEAEWPGGHSGAKEGAILRTFNVSAARYYQALHRFIDTHKAVELDPVLVGRLQRARQARADARASRSLGIRADGARAREASALAAETIRASIAATVSARRASIQSEREGNNR